MLRIAFRSLSAVPVLCAVSSRRSAVNIKAGGTINRVGLAAINKPLSSVKAAMSIIAFSKDVSLRSAAVLGRLLFLPPETKG